MINELDTEAALDLPIYISPEAKEDFPTHRHCSQKHSNMLPSSYRAFPYIPVQGLGKNISFVLQRHKKANGSVVEAVLHSQGMERYCGAFFAKSICLGKA